ncbi:efflux RND transporter periplasmic adaptor subunit [Pseudomonas sp. Xaverov 259]|uniref:efflux RND transporter periplasmic adaptor subunit n=1 Tax=Pseudomonas sp. Xaverov 259 TaxID=2666086 RepID=UPI00214B0721|nr:efflux RND transporter periplasmic adaptor subunit [Pseudomonas sp. Xaverov 259]
MRYQKKKRAVFLVFSVMSLIAAVWYFALPSNKGPDLVAAVPVRVVSVLQHDVARFTKSIGSVVSLHSVVIRAQVDGVLTQLSVEEGSWVKRGDLLATIDDRSIRASVHQGQAARAASQAQLDVAMINLARYAELLPHDGISKQLYDQQHALVVQLKAQVQGDQAAIEAAHVLLSHTQVRSPVSGRVGMRAVDVGNVLRTSDTLGLFSVTQVDPIAIEFSLPQAMLPTLHRLVGETSAAQVNAFASASTEKESGKLLSQGKLSLIDNQIQGSTGTIRVKAIFSNSTQALWPGQLVTVSLQTALDKAVLVVPPGVVQRGVVGHFVYRVAGAKAQAVVVQVMHQDSERVIIKGVQSGDILISSGQSRLKHGSRIRVVTEPLHKAQDVAQEVGS